MSALSCFDNIVGLSRTECNCYDVSGANTSLSGLYLDELEGMNIKKINALEDCSKGGLVERWQKIWENAINNTRADIITNSQKFVEPRFEPYSGVIGLAQKNATVTNISKQYAFIRFICRELVASSITIKKFGAVFEATGTKDILVYNNLNELKGSFTINTVANVHTETVLTTPMVLPLFDERVERVEYYFVYEVGANRPKNNALNCVSCGTSYIFDKNRPCWQTPTAKKISWSNFVCVASGQTDTLDFETSTTHSEFSTYMMGLTIGMTIACNFLEYLCSDDFDFVNDPVAASLALALRYKAGELFIYDIVNSGDVNRYTMIDSEQLQANAAFYATRYKEMVEYVSANIDLTKSDCWICKEFFGFQKQMINA